MAPPTNRADRPNPALASFERLIGAWKSAGRHPHLPGQTFEGSVRFDWLHGGAFVQMQMGLDGPGFPEGLAIFGTDDAQGTCWMLYFDERGVSRRYQVDLLPAGLRWRRDDATLAQRFTLEVAADGQTMTGRGEMSHDGGPWGPDLALDCTRVGGS